MRCMPHRHVLPDLVRHVILMDGLCMAWRLHDARRMFDRTRALLRCDEALSGTVCACWRGRVREQEVSPTACSAAAPSPRWMARLRVLAPQ